MFGSDLRSERCPVPLVPKLFPNVNAANHLNQLSKVQGTATYTDHFRIHETSQEKLSAKSDSVIVQCGPPMRLKGWNLESLNANKCYPFSRVGPTHTE
jgi:hypothetical protein